MTAIKTIAIEESAYWLLKQKAAEKELSLRQFLEKAAEDYKKSKE